MKSEKPDVFDILNILFTKEEVETIMRATMEQSENAREALKQLLETGNVPGSKDD
jgi:hypothetical protein